ncbi:MAG: universal stress protein, partial [Candidatus Binatia bacterium]
QNHGTVYLLYVIPKFVMHMAGFTEHRDETHPDHEVYEPLAAAGGVKRVSPERVSQGKLEEIARERGLSGEVPYKTITHIGDPAESIIEVIREEGIDLAILARRRKTWLESMVVGSVTAKILHAAPCSLLILHEQTVGDT